MGTIYLMVPKVRHGRFIPFFINEKKRSEAALINVIQEDFVNGDSTRKIDKLTKIHGIESISPWSGFQFHERMNGQVNAFRECIIESAYPVL